MRVLWLATSPSLFKEEKVMGWIGALEHVIRSKAPDIQLGITFEDNHPSFKIEKNDVTYYPISIRLKKSDIIKMKFNGNDNWYLKKPLLMQIIEDFRPDVIHCFGSEWNWGLIAEDTKIPVVLHMQGFINIYNDANNKVLRKPFSFWHYLVRPRVFLQGKFLSYYNKKRNENERKIMRSCRFFMGRTEWDKNIVKYFSPNSKYYYCPEAIRPTIYDSNESWTYRKSRIIKIVTIASAGDLKGNGIILETAKILKGMGIDFEWRVSGDKIKFGVHEYYSGIRASDVNVELLGYIGVEQVKQELLDAEIFVLPSIMDNSPNSLCEAQLMGIPVIASFVGGIPDLVDNNKTGLLYPYNEPYALAYKILDLHSSPDKLKSLSQREMEASHNRHNPNLLTERLREIYFDIIKNSDK